ncbi:MAG: ribosome small subunit-dependent GTPase A [Bacteroidales bacterium]|nr:ribosome small subunit-dependent GTPase A [Bacteroidales bacterium]
MSNKIGLVIKTAGNLYTILTPDNLKIHCKLTGKYRLEGLKSTNPVVVGDRVEYACDDNDQFGRIVDVKERKNYIIRKSSNLSKTHQVIAANLDLLLLMATIEYPKTYAEFIDRYLVTAEAYNIPVIILFNKTDLYSQKHLHTMEEWSRMYQEIGYRCMAITAIDKKSVEALNSILKDKVTLIAGNSGVGKSTLINTLDPTLQPVIKEISDYHKKGKHTTTFVEMYSLSSGGFIIDSPGIKGFGLIDMEDEPLFHYFPEFFDISKECKFNNCIHINEPGCAVLEALENGKISQLRYKSYISLLNEQEGSQKYRDKF